MKDLIAYIGGLSGLDFVVETCEILESLDLVVTVTHHGAQTCVLFQKRNGWWNYDSRANWCSTWGFFGSRQGQVPSHFCNVLDN